MLAITFQILRVYPLKSTDQVSNSFFADSVVDADPDNCENSHLYISDLSGYGLVVYSWAKNDSWRISHNFFHFDPLHGEIFCTTQVISRDEFYTGAI